jgi:hypothetical protein
MAAAAMLKKYLIDCFLAIFDAISMNHGTQAIIDMLS